MQKQVGKSTLLKKTLRSFDGQIGGFFTLRTCEYLKPAFLSIFFPPLSLQIRMKPTFSLSVARLRRFHQMKRPDGLTAWGCNALSDFLQKDLILMDELGPHEAEAVRFRQMILKVLDGPVPVLGVLQEAPSPFLQENCPKADVTGPAGHRRKPE